MPSSPASSEAAPVRGACFGFEVRSAFPFSYVREGGGRPLSVSRSPAGSDASDEGDQLLIEWTPREGRALHARLYARNGGYRLWVSGGGSFCVDPEAPAIEVPPGGDAAQREQRLWGIPTLLCFLARGDVPLHAAAVEVDGEAVILAAPGNFGKTTLTAAFYRAGHRMLSEDLTCIRMVDKPAIVPGPALVRLRHDVAEQLDLPDAELVSTAGGRHHMSLTARRGDCAPVPLRGIVFLRPGDALDLRRADAAEAIRDLWALGFRLPHGSGPAECFQRLATIADSVPVWDLARPLRLDALDSTVEQIAARV